MQDFVACKVPFFGGTEPKLFLLKRETRKIVLVMKITAVLMLAAVLQVSAKSWGQEKITLSFNNAPLEQVLNSIHSQANVEFIYRTDYVKDKKVTVNVSNASLKTVLDLCLQNQQLTYDIFGKNVSIHPEKREGKDSKPSDNSVSGSGPGDVTGRVTDPQGEPISGANVLIKRTGSGTITNANGQFTLKNVNTDDIIVISFVGYSPLSVKVGDKTNFLLVMNIAVNKLDAAVVQAYGKTTERLRTGNIATVTSQEIEQHPVMNVLQALQGKVPGLEIVQSSGFASAPYKVEIRGRKYLNNGLAPDPLIIVDGVPLDVIQLNSISVGPNGTTGFNQAGVPNPIGGQSPLFSIDPNEIESVTVLKDADATSIYGSRGGSGVILITTKKGKPGNMKCDVSYSTGFNKNLRWFDLMNTEQYLEMRKEAFANDHKTPTLSKAPDLLKWDSARNTDWQRYTYGGTGRVTNVNATVSGGIKTTTYRFSVGYDTRTNITTSSGSNDRIAFSNNFLHSSPDNKFKLELTNMYTYVKVNTTQLPSSTLLLPPNAPSVYDANNKINFNGWNPVAYFVEPFGALFNTYRSKTSFLNNRLSLSFLPIQGLQLKTALGYNTFNSDETYIQTIAGQNPQNSPTGLINIGTTRGQTLILEPQIEYKKNIHQLKTELMVGSSIQSSNGKTITAAGNGYMDDNLLGSVSNAPTSFGTDSYGETKYFALFGRANFNLNDVYVINLSARRDGSSKFGPGKQFGNFWSIGGAYIMSAQRWFQSISKVISFAKLRGSFGTVGSDNIAQYGYLTRWSGNLTIVNPYGGIQAYQPTQHANPELQWQENRKLEIGANLNFWKDKISTEIDWYRDRCGNQLLDMPLPLMTGFATVSANLPATVQNSGWEFKLNVDLLNAKDLKLSFNFNIGANRNKLLAFPNISNTVYANQYVIGKPLTSTYLYKFTGVDPQTGLYTFEDKNHDGVVGNSPSYTDPDAAYTSLVEKYFGGFGLNLSYKNLSISTFFTYGNLPLVPRLFSSFFPGNFGPFANQPTIALDRWRKPGDVARFAKYSTVRRPTDIAFSHSDGFYSRGSYISLQNISLTYSLSSRLIRLLRMQNASLFARAENIFLLSKYEGLDPRLPGLGSYPYPMTMTLGAKFGF